MPAAAPKFSDLFTIDQFRDLIRAADGPSDSQGQKLYADALETLVEPALRQYLGGKLGRGELHVVPNSDGHDTPFLTAWNAVVRDVTSAEDAEHHWTTIVEEMAHPMIGHWCFVVPEKGSTTEAERSEKIGEAYAKLSDLMDSGDIAYSQIEPQECSVTGERYRVQFKDWLPTFVSYGTAGARAEMRPAPEPSAKEFEVTFPTGELLVADWFRIPAFTDIAMPSQRPSINSEAGREFLTGHHASMGFVSVNVGNTCPSIHDRDGMLIFGRSDHAGLGTVCTDYWAVTVIDKAHLVEILTPELGEQGAAQAVEDYLEENGDVVRLHVERGTYWLYMTGESEKFEGVAPDDLDAEGIEPMFALSPRRLGQDLDRAGPAP